MTEIYTNIALAAFNAVKDELASPQLDGLGRPVYRLTDADGSYTLASLIPTRNDDNGNTVQGVYMTHETNANTATPFLEVRDLGDVRTLTTPQWKTGAIMISVFDRGRGMRAVSRIARLLEMFLDDRQMRLDADNLLGFLYWRHSGEMTDLTRNAIKDQIGFRAWISNRMM